MSDDNDDDMIIALAFMQLKEAILKQDWRMVARVYYDISGEEIVVPEPPKSRIQAIRANMGKMAETTKTPSPPKNKRKYNKKSTAKAKQPEEESVADNEETKGEVDIHESDIKIDVLSVKKNAPFGSSEIKLISTGIDKEEAAKNKKLARHKFKIPKREPGKSILEVLPTVDEKPADYDGFRVNFDNNLAQKRRRQKD